MKISYQDINSMLFDIINLDESLGIEDNTTVIKLLEGLEKQSKKTYNLYKEDFEYKLSNVVAAYNTLRADYDRVCEALNLATNKNEGEYWGWQGDDYNNIETLSVPVLIPAECLRDLLDKTYTEGLTEGYRLKRKFNPNM